MEKLNNQYDYLINLMIIGDSKVGKTSFLERFSVENFKTSHSSNIGVDYKFKSIEIDDKILKLQIWDAAEESFQTILHSYYRKANGFILAYDCTDENSFKNIRKWAKDIINYSSKDVSIVLIATKCDMPDKKIWSDQGEALSSELRMTFFETSAKDNFNISETFNF